MGEKFGRWHILFIQYIKRDWKKIIIWILGVGLFSAGLIPAFEEIAKGGGMAGMYETLKNPAMISLIGPTPVKTANNYTLGAMYAHEMLLFCGLFAMIISMLHVIGHSRKEEDLGLTELVRSFQIGRQSNSLAVMAETVLINLLMVIFIVGIMMSFGADNISLTGSVLFGASIGLAGIMGAATAIFMAQIMPVSSTATASSLGLMGFLYILRGATDIYSIRLSIYNPLGWIYLTYPFTENNWMPIIFGIIFTAVVVAAAFVLEGNRDMGAGYLPEREGRAYAKKSLLSVPGLFIRLNKSLIISWLTAFLILSAAYGAIYGDMEAFLQSNELMKKMFTYTGISVEKSFTSTVMLVMVDLITVLPIALVNKLFSEEKNLYLSQIHGTKVKRSQLYWTSLALAIGGAVAGLLLVVIGLGGTAISVMEGSPMSLIDFFNIGFNFLPSILFFTGLASLALGWIPKLGKTVYIYLVYSFFLNYFGAILDLPNWIVKSTPQSWLAKLPAEDFNIKIYIAMTLVSILLIVVGYYGYTRRDMIEGA